ncbi:MAG TPA: membrane dipeptidase [Polyangiaceae bacterium]|nr:membrane dipeptidase [Polyangiaceae bacterium]
MAVAPEPRNPSLGPYERPTVERLVEQLSISRAAAELYLASEVIDLHVESFSFTRSFGYDLRKRHGPGPQRALLVGQADFPRLLEAGVSGAIWSITQNPLRPPEGRGEVFASLLGELRALLDQATPQLAFVRNLGEYRAARARGAQAAFIGVQGAAALDPDPRQLSLVAPELIKVSLLHLFDSAVGRSSTFAAWPDWLLGRQGLAGRGAEFVEVLNAERVLVDLAHIHPDGFWSAYRLAEPTQPLIVSHTGVAGVHRHWRNLDDAQLRAVAERGGTVGIIYHSEFLGDGLFSGRLATVVAHIRHALSVVGEDHVSLGSDWDGLICTPRDMPTCLELPRLVDALLGAGVPELTIQKVLGENFLRVLGALNRDGQLAGPTVDLRAPVRVAARGSE